MKIKLKQNQTPENALLNYLRKHKSIYKNTRLEGVYISILDLYPLKIQLKCGCKYTIKEAKHIKTKKCKHGNTYLEVKHATNTPKKQP